MKRNQLVPRLKYLTKRREGSFISTSLSNRKNSAIKFWKAILVFLFACVVSFSIYSTFSGLPETRPRSPKEMGQEVEVVQGSKITRGQTTGLLKLLVPALRSRSTSKDPQNVLRIPNSDPGDEKPHYEIDPISFGTPNLFEDREEVFFCDRRHWRTDVCTMKGDVRLDARRNVALLYAKTPSTSPGVETVKPYTRKWEFGFLKVNEIVLKCLEIPSGITPWEASTLEEMEKTAKAENLQNFASIEDKQEIMSVDFDETYEMGNGTNWSEKLWKIRKALKLPEHVTQLWFQEEERQLNGQKLVEMGGIVENVGRHAWVVFNGTSYATGEEMLRETPILGCDIRHSVPGVVFSTSGYIGNVFHEFTDVLIPLYATTAHLKGHFVLVIENAELWWILKYEGILRKLSYFPFVLLGKERYIHCFPELIVGLRFHDELSIFPELMPKPQFNIQKFKAKLAEGWKDWPHFPPRPEATKFGCKPLITLISRDKTRVITNEKEVVFLAKKMGFFVRVLHTESSMPLPVIWKNLQESNVLIGVHGAGITHFLFMRPKSCYIQIVPLGIDWLGKTYCGDPAIRMGLQYTEYKVDIEESSLEEVYPRNHSVLVDPENHFHNVGWSTAKELYLEHQNVTLNMEKFKGVLETVRNQVKEDPLYKKFEVRRYSRKCRQLA